MKFLTNEVLSEAEINQYPPIEEYINQFENEKSDFEGYKVMDIADGKRAIVLTSTSTLTLSNVELTSLDTAITVERGNEGARSFIIVLLNDIKGALYVYDQEGKELDGSGYYE